MQAIGNSRHGDNPLALQLYETIQARKYRRGGKNAAPGHQKCRCEAVGFMLSLPSRRGAGVPVQDEMAQLVGGIEA